MFKLKTVNDFRDKLCSKNVVLSNDDYTKCLKSAKKGDFVYLDPPYFPVTKYDEIGYNNNSAWKEHEFERFFAIVDELTKAEVFVMISNSNSAYVKKFFSRKKYRVLKIPVKRPLAKVSGIVKYELLIMNY